MSESKKVIFVGGTAYSGSTFFHMMLGNDPHGFACGEVRWSFHPHRSDHVNRLCSCGDPNCWIWQTVLKEGEQKVYELIFQTFPDVNFIVDSSKSPYWIHDQSNYLRARGYDVRHLLIWKSPAEFAASKIKRKEPDWAGDWSKYHRLYFSLIDEFGLIGYQDLSHRPELLAEVCHYVDLPYVAGKENFWEKEHHILGGNYSAKLHLGGKAAKRYATEEHHQQGAQRHQTIYYVDQQDDALAQEVQKHAALVADIDDFLKEEEGFRVVRKSEIPGTLRRSSFYLALGRMKYVGMTKKGQWTYRPDSRRAASLDHSLSGIGNS
ncbi:MAG: hypothetical protein KDE58_31100 [Caldilineaceae bacterium]|nr:hypothetical protein [Caldilineaceae bacterium]